MITKIDKFIATIKETKNENDFSVFTQIIKNERIKRNQTLENMAKGICSVSYLSKLENNAIKPSEDYVKALLERVDVKYEDINNQNFDEELNTAIKFYFYQENQKIKELYEKIQNNHFDSRIEMIKCLMLLNENKYEEFKKIISNLDEIKNTFVGRQAVILVYLVSEYYIKQSQYGMAYYYLMCLKRIDINSYELKKLIDESKLLAAFHLNKFNEVYQSYLTIKSEEVLGYPRCRKIKNSLIMKMISGFSNENDIEEIENLLSTEKWIIEDEKTYYYVLLNFAYMKEYQKVIDIVEENGLFQKDYFLALYGYSIDQLNNEEKKQIFLEKVECLNEIDISKIHLTYLNYLKIKFIDEKSYSLFEYLRYEAIPYMNTHQHILYNESYNKKYVDLLMKLSRYKDAVVHLLNYQ